VEKFYGGEGEVNRSKTQREFVIVTLIALISIALIIAVYASLLATFQGGEVTVGGISANVQYSTTNSTGASWSANLYNVTGSWYTRNNFTSTYQGTVKITWQLEKNTGSWGNVSTPVITTSYTLNGNGSQLVYAGTDGLISSNQDWSSKTSGDGSYRVVVYVETV